jgi:hypothetical protein
VGGIALDLHATAATVALLAAPKFAVEKSLIDFQSRGHAGKKGDESLAMGFSRGEIAQHKFSIVPDARDNRDCGTANVPFRAKKLVKEDFDAPLTESKAYNNRASRGYVIQK